MHGVLIVDKHAGPTSHDVIARVRRIVHEKRVGHTGTLDPFATGVLVVLVGRATRLAQFLSGADKEYEAVIRFGYATDTGDVTGTPRGEQKTALSWTEREIESALANFRGEIDQVPPMYSAKKQQGRKLYELARRGEEVERKPVRVTIHEFEAVRRDGALLKQNDDGTCDLMARVVCSAGTYIRTLAQEIGAALGVGAHLAALRRTRAGEFHIDNAITLDQLQQHSDAGSLSSALISLDAALGSLPSLQLNADNLLRVRHGMNVRPGVDVDADWRDDERVRLRDEAGNLIAIGFYDVATHSLHPRVVVADVA